MTSSSRTPDPSGPADEPRAEAPKTRLSLTQIVASALAAVSATVLMSFFGVAGTIIGAGLASVVTVIGNFFYTRSIEKTHEQLKPVVTQLASKSRRTTETSHGTVVTVADAGGGTTVETPVTTGSAADPLPGGDDGPTDGGDPAGSEEPAEEPRNAWLRFVEKHGTKKVLAVSAAALFVVVMGVVLVIELAIGKPLSDAVRGQEGSGTSISRSSTDSGGSTPDPTPSGPAEDPANVPGDQSTGDPTTGTTDGSTDGTTDTPTQEPAPDPTGGTDSGTDPSTGGGTDGGTDGSTDGTTDGGTDSGTSGGTDGGTTGDGSDGGTTGGGTDTGSGTDTGTGTGSGSTDAEQGTGTSSGGSAQEGASPTPTPAS
ncbi:hypothetical protein [Isoptericola sp. NPDC057559]|uniref:hypothetical protein n=1 Tax=Isoptericola sp. NPDC057559 TaxID=3346168 RepID=UPI00369EDED5